MIQSLLGYDRPNHSSVDSAKLLPFASELQGALADGFAEDLVRREGGEPIGLRVELGSQDVMRILGLTLGAGIRVKSG